MLFALLAALSPEASAFCGTYVGQAGANLENRASQIAVARQGTRTTLTMNNDYEGDATDFAFLVPVPTVLAAEDIRLADASVFSVLDNFSAPRLVSYTCDSDGADADWADTGRAQTTEVSETEYPTDDAVTVEAAYALGAYEIVVLSATESAGLLNWLDSVGYSVPAESAELLQEYIDGGSYFFAAQVSLDRAPEAGEYLSPLRLSYASEVFSLPVRLGTVNSTGEQDLVLYMLTDLEDGAVGISNYPEIAIPDECMFEEDLFASFGDFYEGRLADTVENGRNIYQRSGWMREYSWEMSWCDPCSGDPPNLYELGSLGFTAQEGWFTRLHLRYAPGDVDQDVVLYASGLQESQQQRYIVYDACLEGEYNVCETITVAPEEQCGNADDGDGFDVTCVASDGSAAPDDTTATATLGCGCNGVGGNAWLGGGILALLARRRRP